MLNFMGLPLLERQVRTLRSCGIEDISIVRGFRPEKIQIEGVKYYENPQYDTTNMVSSLFCADEELIDDVVVCYADIVYENRVIEAVIAADCDIGVTVDTDYLDYWRARLDDWESDLETFNLDQSGNVLSLGAPTRDTEQAALRYVGLIKFSKKGVTALKELFYQLKEQYWNADKPWLSSKSFRQAYFTDILQALINEGNRVCPIAIERGWLEFDTVEDYEKAVSWAEDGTLQRFIKL